MRLCGIRPRTISQPYHNRILCFEFEYLTQRTDPTYLWGQWVNKERIYWHKLDHYRVVAMLYNRVVAANSICGRHMGGKVHYVAHQRFDYVAYGQGSTHATAQWYKPRRYMSDYYFYFLCVFTYGNIYIYILKIVLVSYKTKPLMYLRDNRGNKVDLMTRAASQYRDVLLPI